MKNLTSHKITKWETQRSLALSMRINYQEITLRLGHYAITNEGKGSAALVRTIVFNVSGSRIISSKKSLKVQSIFSIFWSYSEFLSTFFDNITKSVYQAIYIWKFIYRQPSWYHRGFFGKSEKGGFFWGSKTKKLWFSKVIHISIT